MLDANIVMAIVTMMTNKPYLGGEQKPWDPIVFGVLMIAIALGLQAMARRAARTDRGAASSRARLLASERERLARRRQRRRAGAGRAQPHSHDPPPIGRRRHGQAAPARRENSDVLTGP